MRAFFTLLFVFVSLGAFSQTTRYVRYNAAGLNDGTSWANAFTKLQDALAVAESGDEIWVAAGTYYPDEGTGKTDNERTAFFTLKNGVTVYGGFEGAETQITQRNWKINVTTLSGEIQQDADNTNNSYQVIRNSNIDNTAVLDGFTITGGNGNGGPFLNTAGGMYNLYSASPTVTNCTFIQNRAGSGSGGGMSNVQSSPRLINCIFSGNTARDLGGAMFNTLSSSPSLTNCSFGGNSASIGGGICNVSSSSPTLINCILWGNTGGEIENLAATFTVTYSIVQGGPTTNGNKNQDPLFIDAASGNLRLQACSPAIDAGSDAANNTASDLDGNPRKIDAIAGGSQIDMGAYELQGDPITVWVLDKDNDGYYTGSPAIGCTSPGTGYVIKTTQQPGDCVDIDPAVHPGAAEVCDNKDNDCDQQVDEEKPAVNAGADQIVYNTGSDTYGGYSKCATLKATVSGGTAPYTYLWSTGATTQSINVCPTATTTYTVIITDNKGCTVSDQVMVTVIDVRCGNKLDKITVCHKSKNTLCIGKEGVQDHLNHGDKLGDCTGSTGTLTQRSETAEGSIKEQVPATRAGVYPNPTRGQFVVDFRLGETGTSIARLQLIDISGRAVQTESVVVNNGTLQKTIHVSPALTNGIYMLRITTAAGTVYSRKLVYKKR